MPHTHARKPSVRAPHAANTTDWTTDAGPRCPVRSHKLWSNTARFPLRCTRRARTSHHVQTAVDCREAGARAASTLCSAARSRGSSNDGPAADWSRAGLRGRARMCDATRASHGPCQLVMNQLLNSYAAWCVQGFSSPSGGHRLVFLDIARKTVWTGLLFNTTFIIVYFSRVWGMVSFLEASKSKIWHFTAVRSPIRTLIHPSVRLSDQKGCVCRGFSLNKWNYYISTAFTPACLMFVYLSQWFVWYILKRVGGNKTNDLCLRTSPTQIITSS